MHRPSGKNLYCTENTPPLRRQDIFDASELGREEGEKIFPGGRSLILESEFYPGSERGRADRPLLFPQVQPMPIRKRQRDLRRTQVCRKKQKKGEQGQP